MHESFWRSEPIVAGSTPCWEARSRLWVGQSDEEYHDDDEECGEEGRHSEDPGIRATVKVHENHSDHDELGYSNHHEYHQRVIAEDENRLLWQLESHCCHFDKRENHQSVEVHPVGIASHYCVVRHFFTSVQIEEREYEDPY